MSTILRTLAEQDALDIVERKLWEARCERVRTNWDSALFDWRLVMGKLESIRRYLLSHGRYGHIIADCEAGR